MQRLIANIIPTVSEYISTSDPEWHRAQQLHGEAYALEGLLWTLLNKLNSAVEPQASLYLRVERMHDQAQRREHRRSVRESIAMYRAMGYGPERVSPSHVHFAAIVAALTQQQAT